jgi:hypothetical protein
LRFLFASQPAIMGRVLGIVYRAISTHITKKAGYTKTTAHTGAVTLIQRFGGAINLNVQFHMLFLDGAYLDNEHGSATRSKMAALGAISSHFEKVVSPSGTTPPGSHR